MVVDSYPGGAYYQIDSNSMSPGLLAKEIAKGFEKFNVVAVKSNNWCITSDDFLAFYEETANVLGQLVPLREGDDGNKTGEFWTDIKYTPEKADSFAFSNTMQPLHTDGAYESNAPDVVFFFCLQPAKYGGATFFIDGKHLVSFLKENNPGLFSYLKETNVTFAKGDDRKTARIILEDNSGPLLTWNYFRQVSDYLLGRHFHDWLDQHIMRAGLCTPINLRRGDALFFQDNRVLHGRYAFYGDRHLVKGAVKIQ